MSVYTTPTQIPYEYRPLSPWAYLGYTLLYSIPLIGFIFLIVFALSDGNINRRNHARGYFCALLVSVILGVIVWLVFGAALGSLASYM
ncbi:MAG: ABC transporter permease [Clostridia bacterium]|nr:ABC transporter permease [Clostridia bacterium]